MDTKSLIQKVDSGTLLTKDEVNLIHSELSSFRHIGVDSEKIGLLKEERDSVVEAYNKKIELESRGTLTVSQQERYNILTQLLSDNDKLKVKYKRKRRVKDDIALGIVLVILIVVGVLVRLDFLKNKDYSGSEISKPTSITFVCSEDYVKVETESETYKVSYANIYLDNTETAVVAKGKVEVALSPADSETFLRAYRVFKAKTLQL
jgi:hypothetical protein